MKKILSGTGWRITQIIPDSGPGYTAVIAKTGNDSGSRRSQSSESCPQFAVNSSLE
jgi:hypothetical protein